MNLEYRISSQIAFNKLGSSLIYLFLLITTILQKYIVFHLFFLCSRPFDPKLVLINLFFLFVHDHSTKVWGHSYYLIYSSFNCANISRQLFPCILSARFITVLPLPFVTFCTLFWWKCYSYISYAISTAIWSLSLGSSISST